MEDYTPFRFDGVWLKGNLHCHSTVSDGIPEPRSVVDLYRRNGYAFLALTDHEVMTDWQELETPGFTIVPGVETQVYDRARGRFFHVVGLHDRGSLPGRPKHLEIAGVSGYGAALEAQHMIDRMNAMGMYTVFCHPVWSRTELADFEDLSGYQAIEVYNHSCHVECNTGHAGIYWDSLLRRGKRVWAVATDDSHQRVDDSLGGWVMVKAQAAGLSSILTALHNGTFYSSSGPEIHDFGVVGGTVFVECSPVREIHFVTYERRGKSYVCPRGEFISRAQHVLTGDEHYVRVECVDDQGNKAWTNPVYAGG